MGFAKALTILAMKQLMRGRVPSRSHALRGNAVTDALRHEIQNAERSRMNSHAERGN